MNWSQITDQIYVGTNFCCQMHFDAELSAEGITADISLEAEKVDTPIGIGYYIWIPVLDHTAPTLEQFDFGVATIEKLIELGKKIYVHCQHGHGRAPTMVAAYLISAGMSADEAIGLVKTKRPEAHPEPVQIKTLREYEAKR